MVSNADDNYRKKNTNKDFLFVYNLVFGISNEDVPTAFLGHTSADWHNRRHTIRVRFGKSTCLTYADGITKTKKPPVTVACTTRD